MLMPTLSVTLIGLLVAVVLTWGGWPGARPLLGALVGAWAGFALGALAGLAVDVISGQGFFLALAGHAAALPGAILGLHRAVPTARA
ncbi:hypothetical protein [Streptomyces luteolus]|uniref:GlsB/YeaQ/YmgE family stress response membrane protein n=1 Tax=Streptomyces luteolus TaxID=3043615 RepID=A0ABT6T6F3_9ACTN|nr:hypothetical protein [Streptomyces sp. B-S-A12]MDI3423181.1 hypothetical protein [Streptomyces sp. B-S-A12]